ncbi:MAG: 30S ribosomal protein S5 [Parcubacteria group bacterium GW2011_GWA2_38_13b]|nr:MAG: 30S ribosomal protein S5 [Parcubacteria group bacterium GW2011_GWA2_38_13b]
MDQGSGKFKKKTEKFSPREGGLEQSLLEIKRVTRVVAGGKRFRFRAVVVVGDRKGRVGVGSAKGADVSGAVDKAAEKAKKKLIFVKIIKGTIPHEIRMKYGSANIMLKPAVSGKGIIAGGAVRVVCSLAGIADVIGKILGSSNKLNNARATIKALENFKV